MTHQTLTGHVKIYLFPLLILLNLVKSILLNFIFTFYLKNMSAKKKYLFFSVYLTTMTVWIKRLKDLRFRFKELKATKLQSTCVTGQKKEIRN